MNYPTRIRNGRGLTLIERTIAASAVAVMIATLMLTLIGPVSASEPVVLTLDGAASPPAAVISYAQHSPGGR
jgi:hypothetical protein